MKMSMVRGLVVFVAATAVHPSGPIGIYGIVEKVVLRNF
jgi:hypothetical protein